MMKSSEANDLKPRGRRRLMTAAVIGLAAIGFALSGTSFQPASEAVAVKLMATGSGHLRCATCGEYRNFAFSAIKDADGDVNGQAQLNNRSVPVEDHVDVQCVNITGNTAFISGVIKKSKSKADPAFEFPVGTPVIFTVQDNGEGSNALVPDMISLEFQTADPQDCMNGGPVADLPITNGNVQVRTKP